MAAGATITIDDARLQQTFRALVEMGEDPAPVLQEIGDAMVRNVKARFVDERGPGGVPWIPSLRVKANPGARTLWQTPRLAESFTAAVAADGRAVEWGTNVIYAGVHQFGATIRAKTAKALRFNIPGIGWIMRESVTIPARPFIGYDDGDRADTDDIMTDHLLRALEGGGTA